MVEFQVPWQVGVESIPSPSAMSSLSCIEGLILWCTGKVEIGDRIPKSPKDVTVCHKEGAELALQVLGL